MDKNIAIITARGGSKRIPRKNIKLFLGKPIIAYSILSALESKCFEDVMVSTDDEEIAEIARSFGAQVPFYRSVETSNDFATTADVVNEVLHSYAQLGKQFKFACCLYPTAPFVTTEKLRLSYNLLVETNADSVIPVVRFGYPIQRALQIENNRLSMIWPEHINARSQDLPPAYHDSGQFYWINVSKFLKTCNLFVYDTVPVVVPETEVQDIDNEEDWKLAEIKYCAMLTRRHLHECLEIP